MKKMNDEQATLLMFVPAGFQGNKSLKLVYGSFLYCSSCANNRGDDTFSLSIAALRDMTGLCEKTISKCIHVLSNSGKIEMVKRGVGITHKASVYRIGEKKVPHYISENVEGKLPPYNYSNLYENNKTYDKSDDTYSIVLDTYRNVLEPIVYKLIDDKIQEVSHTYEIEISRLKDEIDALNERLNKAARAYKNLKGIVGDYVDQDNNTNVGAKEVGYKSNPNSDSEVDKLIDTLKEGSKAHSASELTGAADKLQSLIDNKALIGQPSKFGLAVNLIREINSTYKTSTVSDYKSTKRMTINRKEPTENPEEYSRLYRLHDLISQHGSVEQRVGEEYFKLIAKCKELDDAGLITSVDSYYFKCWSKPTDPAYQKCLQAVKGSNELSPSVPLAPLPTSEDVEVRLVGE